MNDGMAIIARGLTKKYKQVTAVNNLDLDIPRGTVYGFLGPNGAGKTTTIRMLLGLIEPSAGSAQVLGHDIRRERHAIAPKVGAIVESPAFYTYLTGEQNLRVMARSSNLNLEQRRIDELIEFVGLSGRGRHKVKTYSLGMKQRLGVAATLLNDPDIIFLDEPTNGLDPAGTVDMRNLIARLGQEGHTVFLSSHMLNEVQQVCSDVAIVQRGVTIKQGRVSAMLADGAGYAIEAAPFERAMAVLGEHPELHAASADNHWIAITAQPGDVPALVRALVSADVDVYQVQVRQKSLESLFLELTNEPQAGMAAVPQLQGEVL
ncbi:MAG TPA: ABC transporter ATP-binding protein [Herpetosiphonaceae bacterium]|nr:ABC transporter ATP-binding protein [Herpetosiphonaceae bacterium]